MNIPLSTLKNALLSKTGARALSAITNLYSGMYETVSRMTMEVDLPSAIRVQTLSQPLYTQPNKYLLPSDMDLEALIQLRPVTLDQQQYYYTGLFPQQFLIERGTGKLAIQHIDGNQYILSSVATMPPLVINNCEDNSTNGVWSGGGTVTNVVVDNLYKIQGLGSISFDSGVSALNFVENTTVTAVDLTDYRAILIWVYLPSAPAALTGIGLRFGQSDANYYSGSTATNFYGQAFAAGWNLLKINLNAMTATGTPTLTGVVYLRVDLIGSLSAALLGVKIDSIIANKGEIFEAEYYSNSLFVGADGTRKLIPTADTDSLILSNREYPLFLSQFSVITGVDVRPSSASMEIGAYGSKLPDQYQRFRENFPSRRMLFATDYSSGNEGIAPTRFFN